MAEDQPPATSAPSVDAVLPYALPNVGRRRHRAKHAIAIAFAVIAIGLGLLFEWVGFVQFVRSLRDTTTRDKSDSRENAVRCAACGLVLIVPGIWYARVGLRGEPIEEEVAQN